ncbi:hypothetical protein ACIQCM_06220 [Pseudarthrobacter sp. NPDC092439]|uniref:hypothetical protein n=1 Tax=unclassified Pseudarthrobacter TaxID=2647000 RepID=UPI003806AF85
MNNRPPLMASVLLSAVLLTGCSAAAAGPGTAGQPGQSHGAESHGAHDGGHHQSVKAPARAAAGGPSEAAKMVCGDQPMDRLIAVLDLDKAPHTVNNWADSTFTCTYHLDQASPAVPGSLDISVQEARDEATALEYFDAMQALASDATPIGGLANLGFPAYETADGKAVFQKDSFVLTVDASGLPTAVGPDAVTRNALAYQLATTILACWVEHG